MRLQIDAIYDFANGTQTEYFYNKNGTTIICKDEKNECVGMDPTEAIKCVNDIHCNKTKQEYKVN